MRFVAPRMSSSSSMSCTRSSVRVRPRAPWTLQTFSNRHSAGANCSVLEPPRHELLIAHKLRLPKGSIVAMDRGYIDYRLFNRWSTEGVYFVTRLKENANFWDFEDRPL